MAFMKSTHMKMVSANGAIKRRSPWNTSLTWPSTNSNMISTKACAFDGTPAVALRASNQNHRQKIRPTPRPVAQRSEEHTSELQSLMRISYAVFCLKKKNKRIKQDINDR